MISLFSLLTFSEKILKINNSDLFRYNTMKQYENISKKQSFKNEAIDRLPFGYFNNLSADFPLKTLPAYRTDTRVSDRYHIETWY